MRAARFVPLTCQACGGDLAGREADRAAFCPTCGTGWRVDLAEPAPLTVRTVLTAGAGRGAAESLSLPAWRRGRIVQPAFLSARPLWLARTMTRLAATWRLEPRLSVAPPLGACIPPESMRDACRLARLPEPSGSEPLELLALPCRAVGRRWQLPGATEALYPDDVIEARWLAGTPAG